MKLDDLRKEIEIIDKDLALLIEKRLKICQEIGEEKKKLNLPIFDAKREQILKEKNASYLDNKYQEAYLNILEKIFEESKKLQN